MTAVTAYLVSMDIKGGLTGAGVTLGIIAAVWGSAALANAEPDTAPVVVEAPVEVVKVAPPAPVVTPEPAPVVVPEVVVVPEPVAPQPAAPEPVAPAPEPAPVVEQEPAPATQAVKDPDDIAPPTFTPEPGVEYGTQENPYPLPRTEGALSGGGPTG